jgi:DNA-binding transcriptional MerR regulator
MSQELYKPAEACRIAEVAPYVLRYWETEFPSLSEGREKGGGSRLYSAREVRIISRIRELLYDEGFTVAGAKKRLEAEISEGRFEDGLKPAPAPAEQKKAAAAPPPTGRQQFLGDSETASARPPDPKPSSEFPERKRVVRELKEILRLLERTAKRS